MAIIVNPEPTYTNREAAIARARRESELSEQEFYVVRVGGNQWRVQRVQPLANWETWRVSPIGGKRIK